MTQRNLVLKYKTKANPPNRHINKGEFYLPQEEKNQKVLVSDKVVSKHRFFILLEEIYKIIQREIWMFVIKLRMTWNMN